MGADTMAENNPNAPFVCPKDLYLIQIFVCPSLKVLDFDGKRLHWGSVVRDSVHNFGT